MSAGGSTVGTVEEHRRFPDFNGILVTIPFKVRNINAYLKKLQEVSMRMVRTVFTKS